MLVHSGLQSVCLSLRTCSDDGYVVVCGETYQCAVSNGGSCLAAWRVLVSVSAAAVSSGSSAVCVMTRALEGSAR